jgi:Zn-dependent peptidase ImmA (M78 family)
MKNEEINLGPRKAVAKKLAQQVIKGSGISSAPVSLQKVIDHLQKTHNLNVMRAPLTEKVSGLLVVCNDLDKESMVIGFNPDKPWCHRRFTIAHEIGHIMMSHTCSGNTNDRSHNETEANNFAAELLIPTNLIKVDFKKLQNIPELSKLYRVSAEAMAIKLGDARLLKF